MKRRSRKAQAARLAARWREAIILDRTFLLGHPNVEQVSIGWKERRRAMTRRFAVKIYVRKKPPTRSMPARERLPKTTRVLLPEGRGVYKVHRVPTDVVWYAPPRFCAGPTDLLNPLAGGAEMGVDFTNVGTYACMVADAQGQRFALTAAHVVTGLTLGSVLADLNVSQPLSGAATPAQAALGKTAGGFFGTTPDGFVDFALVRLNQNRVGQSVALDGVVNSGTVLTENAVITGQVRVTKFGAATLRTHAVFSRLVPSEVITGITVTRVYEFKGLAGTPFGLSGDSGALVISTEPASRGAVVGLLFAVTEPTPDAPGGRGYVFPFGRSRLRPVV